MASTKSEQANAATKPSQKTYGKIALTLRNQLLPEDKLRTTPSQLDGLDTDTETDLRIYGCELIQTAGILLKLPQVAMATGQVLLQRFYYSKSLVRHPVDQTAMACVCLASKIEEAPRRVRDVINVFSHIRQVNSNKPIAPVILDQNYIQLKNQVIKAERRVLKELGFCVHIKHPHKIIVMYLQVLGYEKHQNLMQYSWNYMNDSLRTDVFVRYQPETIACACIYLTARKLKIPLPKSPAWYLIFGVTESEIREICVRILRLYNRPKANIDNLEKKVDELCKKYQDAKVKQRVVNSGNNTPNNNGESSPTTQKSTGAHNAWGGFISRSGSHIAPPVSDKRSRSRSGSNSPAAKHHKRTSTKKNRSRSPRSPVGGRTAKKSSRKQQQQQQQQRRGGSYSRSRSVTPVKVVRKGRDKKRTPSNDRENKNDRYIDRYDKYEKNDRYKEDRYQEKERYEDKDRKEKYEKKYDREDRYRDDKESRYKKSKHREDQRDRERSKDRRR